MSTLTTLQLVASDTHLYTGLAYNQLTGNLISQAATMQVHGLPNEILGNLDPLALIIFIPICPWSWQRL